MTTILVALTRWALIAGAILLSPFYALWVGGGWVADRLESRPRVHDRIP